MSSSKSFRFVADAKTAYLLHQRTLQENRCISDLVRRAVQQYLAIEPANEPDVGVERVEFAQGAKATACYLTGPISACVERLAKESDRSRSWIVRNLLRCELRRRGLLAPLPATAVDNPTS
jgi:hypothetical protein